MRLAGRIVASLAHGAFFGIGSVVAAELVAPERKAGAIAMMFTGLTVADVVGVPGGTLVGQAIGRRVTFFIVFIVAALGLVGLLGIAELVADPPKPEGVRLRHELAAFKDAQVLLAMAMTVLGFGGVFAAITYTAPMMTEVFPLDKLHGNVNLAKIAEVVGCKRELIGKTADGSGRHLRGRTCKGVDVTRGDSPLRPLRTHVLHNVT